MRVSVTDNGVQAALAGAMRLLRAPKPLTQAMGAALERNINLRFDTKTDPSGDRWAAWGKATAAARKKEGRGNLLEYTGRMRDSLTYLADSKGVDVGFGVDYAARHEYGEGVPRRAMLLDNGDLGARDYADILSAAFNQLKKQIDRGFA